MTNYLEQTDWNKIDASTDAPAYVDYLARLDTTSRMQHFRQHFLQHLPCCPGERVVDAGCGIGSATGALRDRVGEGGWVLGLDRSRHMMRQARSQSHTGIAFGAGDLCHLPLCSGSVDGIVCDRVLMHLERPLAALREMHRVLRPGGWLGLSEPDWSVARMEPDGEVRAEIQAMQASDDIVGVMGLLWEELQERLPPIAADERRLTQHVLVNLVKNAITFTPAGEVRIGARAEEDSVQFWVTDTGIGIAEEEQERIFDNFYQVDGSSTRRAEGVGLGLAIARKFVEMHGGRLWVESAVGEGSTFRFTVPKANQH